MYIPAYINIYKKKKKKRIAKKKNCSYCSYSATCHCSYCSKLGKKKSGSRNQSHVATSYGALVHLCMSIIMKILSIIIKIL